MFGFLIKLVSNKKKKYLEHPARYRSELSNYQSHHGDPKTPTARANYFLAMAIKILAIMNKKLSPEKPFKTKEI